MNILIIGPIPPVLGGSSFGGIATHIDGLAHSLVFKNNTVSLWYHKPQKSFSEARLKVISNTVVDYLMSSFLTLTLFFKRELHYLSIKQNAILGFQIYRLRKILKNNKFDCIHVHSLHNTSAIAFQYISEELVPKIVITDHGFWQDPTTIIFDSKSHKKIRAVSKQCEKIIYISNYAKEQHLKIDFGQKDKLVKIKNPINVTIKLTKPIMSNDKHIIFFNGLTESLKIKQFDLLLTAIQEDKYLRNNSCVIAIVNSDAHNYVLKNKFDFEIELYAATTWGKVKELYLRSNIFVLPSKSESFGLSYLEALSFGLPIIGFEDVFKEFQDNIQQYIGEAFNSKTETSSQLAEKIKKVINTNFDYNKVHNELKKAYNWEDNIIHYESIYKKT